MYIYPSPFFEDRPFRVDPHFAFVLMPFTVPWSQRIYSVLREIVTPLGYECKRADDFYGRIVLTDIWEQINQAAFIIADLTGQNPNVYYELGIVHTLGKDVIPLLQRDQPVPFDQRPFRIIMYEDNADGYKVLHSELPSWIASLKTNASPQLLLKNEAVAQFNEWRHKGKAVHFIGEDFSGLNLRGVNFSDARLNESSFKGADLSDAVMVSCFLIRADLTDCSMVNAILDRSNLSEAHLENCRMDGATLRNSIMLRPRLSGASLADADVDGLTIDHASFTKFRPLFLRAKNLDHIIVER